MQFNLADLLERVADTVPDHLALVCAERRLTYIAVDDGIAADGKVHPDATIPSDDYERTLAAASPDRDFAPRSPDDLYLLYTGGTTGMPKGVMWRHLDLFFGAMAGAGGGG